MGCPRCGREDAALWLARQRTRLLPVPYFLVTFTVPEQLREPIRAAQLIWYAALLRESARALQDLAAQPKHLGAELGLTAMLQTWTRDLRYHPHQARARRAAAMSLLSQTDVSHRHPAAGTDMKEQNYPNFP